MFDTALWEVSWLQSTYSNSVFSSFDLVSQRSKFLGINPFLMYFLSQWCIYLTPEPPGKPLYILHCFKIRGYNFKDQMQLKKLYSNPVLKHSAIVLPHTLRRNKMLHRPSELQKQMEVTWKVRQTQSNKNTSFKGCF